MAQDSRCHSFSGTLTTISIDAADTDLSWPFGELKGLDKDDIRETAYEVFFTACRSSPGFGGGRNAINFYSNHHHQHHDGDGAAGTGSPTARMGGGPVVVMSPTSRIKRALGLKMLKKSPTRRMSAVGSSGAGTAPVSPSGPLQHGGTSPALGFATVPVTGRPRRPLTSAEIMRAQMRVTEHSDNRLRKTLMRTLVGQIVITFSACVNGDETLVLDEVDELVELIKKAWSALGINRPIHNLCLAWVLFQQYVLTSQVEPDLLYATHAMLSTEVANDAKKPDREAMYVKLLSSMLASMQGWAERRLLHYHDYFQRGNVFLIENLLPLALSASKILGEDVTITEGAGKDKGDTQIVDSSGDRVDHYIRASVKKAFAKIIETGSYKSTSLQVKDEASEALLQLAKEVEDLALRERESFSPILKKWNPIVSSVAAVTLHQCYGAVLKQYIAGISTLNNETVAVLQSAGKLEKFLVQMLVEDSADCEDGGKTIVREMIPYEVDSVILKLMKQWFVERLDRGKDCLSRAKDSESKLEPYATSAAELMKIAKEAVNDFFEIPVGITDDLIYDLAEGFDNIFKDYTNLVAACGSKQSYVPTLPPLTRCNRDSKFLKLWKKAAPCSINTEDMHQCGVSDAHHPRPSTSRGTQRLYIRLNTLHYLLTHLHSLEKNLALAPRTTPSRGYHRRHRINSSSYFELALASIQTACQHVSEVAAYRLIFLDSNSVFYDSLYVADVENSRIRHALRIIKQNLSLLTAILIDGAQPLAMREVMKASFEAFLTVLLAGGCSRVFYRSDYPMIEEDFAKLKRTFCTCGEGLMNEEAVEKEAEIVEGVIALMSDSTEKLMEDFSILACEASGIGVVGSGHNLPMPPTTGRWNRADPNTIVRVLCHRNDKAANHFLKKAFQLAKRR
ncbi:hypothetical protein Peur_005183 [Populus x canadensis]